jgi:hypothetical protein
VRDLAAAQADFPGRLAGRGVPLLAMEPIAPSLEDVFVALITEAGGAPVD